MTLDPLSVMRATQLILGAGLALQAAEILATRAEHARMCAGDRSVEQARRWLTASMIVRLAICAALICGVGIHSTLIDPILYLGLIITSAGLIARFGGSIGGGSDSMFFQVQVGLLVASLGVVNPALVRIGLGWIAAQSVLSYFIAGGAKLRNRDWRNGVAMANLLRTEGPYVLFRPARVVGNSRTLCVALSWALVLFELVFPFVLLLPWEAKLVVLAAGFLFHLANAAVLGLNRFVWAWSATYPALLFV